MAELVPVVIAVAVACAAASWIFGAVYYVRTLQAIGKGPDNSGMMWSALFNWMFASRELKGEAGAHASKVNMAIWFFMASVVAIAVATFAAAGLQRVK